MNDTALPHLSAWCQRWNQGRHSWVHRRHGGFNARRYQTVDLPEAEAKHYVLRHHYAHSWPSARMRFGMVDRHDGSLCGVLVLGVPVHQHVLTRPFPDLEPSLNQFVASTYSYPFRKPLPVGHSELSGMDPLAGTDPVIVGSSLRPVAARLRAATATFGDVHSSTGAWPAEAVRVDVGHGLAYWSVLAGPLLAPVEPMDHFLRYLRFARGAAESTTRTYAGHLKRFESWRAEAGLSWEAAARDIAGYVIRLRTTPRSRPGRGYGRLPTGAALVPALAAIHGFYRHAADIAAVDQDVLGVLFELAELRFGGASVGTSLRPRLRVDARPSNPPHLGPVAATTDEVAAMVAVARTARDACVIAFLSGLALRVGQVASLWREDVHLVPPGRRVPGCAYTHGPHVHVVRRDGHPRGAISKARAANVVPVPPPVELFYAQWLRERQAIAGAELSPWAFVSFPGPANNQPGQPLSTRRLYAIVSAAARAAGLRHIHPHMLRHAFGSVAADLNVARDVLQHLLGHSSPASQDPYRQVSAASVAEAASLIGDRFAAAGFEVP